MDFNQYCDRLPAMCQHASKKDTITTGKRFLTSWVKNIIVNMQEMIRAYKTELKLNNKQIAGCTEDDIRTDAVHTAASYLAKTKSVIGLEDPNANLPLAQRTFICDECGFVIDRDYNASLNLRQVAVSSPDTLKTPIGEESSGLFCYGASETIFDESGNKHYLGTGDLNG